MQTKRAACTYTRVTQYGVTPRSRALVVSHELVKLASASRTFGKETLSFLNFVDRQTSRRSVSDPHTRLRYNSLRLARGRASRSFGNSENFATDGHSTASTRSVFHSKNYCRIFSVQGINRHSAIILS